MKKNNNNKNNNNKKHKGIKLITLLPAKHGMFFIQMTTGAIRNKASREKKRLRLE